jgi:hypothetical protein
VHECTARVVHRGLQEALTGLGWNYSSASEPMAGVVSAPVAGAATSRQVLDLRRPADRMASLHCAVADVVKDHIAL